MARRSGMRGASLAFVVLLGFVSLLGLVQAQTEGGVLNLAYREELRTLDFIKNMGTEGLYVLRQVSESMVSLDEQGNIVPALATHWEQPDTLTYVFHLRPGVLFHSGVELTAADVKYSWERLIDPDSGSQQWERYSSIIATVEAIDDLTVGLNLHQPWPEIFDVMAHLGHLNVINQRSVEAHGEAYGVAYVDGTGPFKYKAWLRDEHFAIERFDDYWGGRAYLDEIVFRPILEDSTRSAQFSAGQLDVLYDLRFDEIPRWEQDPDVDVYATTGGTFNWIVFNTAAAPFDDKLVRQAVYYAIDRQGLVDAFFHGRGEAGTGPLPSWHWGFADVPDVYPHDPERAVELLAEAGYSSSSPLTFDLSTSNAPHYLDLATYVQAQLAAIGVRVSIVPYERTAVFDEMRVGNYDAALFRFITAPLTSEVVWRRYHSLADVSFSGLNREGGAQRPGLDELIDELIALDDHDAQREVLVEIVDAVNDEAVMLILNWEPNVNVARSYVRDLPILLRDDAPLRRVWIAVP